MKKVSKLLVSFMAAVLLLGSALTVFAEPSRSEGPYVSGDAESNGWYVILTDDHADAFDELKVNEPDVYELIMKFNRGEIAKEVLFANYPEILNILTSKVAVTEIFDLVPVNGGNVVNGKHVVSSVTVPGLKGSNWTGVVFVHYNEEAKAWEVVTPTHVDYSTGEIFAEFDHLSPVGVFATTSSPSGSTATDTQTPVTSPQTEGSSVWGLWIGAAVVLAACGFAVVYKKRAN